jgi:hypothetical protein
MSVVQRCPNCGTTRATSGECEACHEAQVRYFCTNHTPGLWLDASTCPTCGARFGDPARGPSAAAPAISVRTRSAAAAPVIPLRPRSPAPFRAPASTSAPPPPYARMDPPEASADAWRSRKRSPPLDEEELEPRGSRMAPLWQQILQAAVRARYMPTRTARYRERLPIERGAGGCLKRLLIVMLLLSLALASAVFLFGRALLGY